MSLPNIALAGATGNLGLPLLHALLSSNYKVTALSRINGNSSSLPSHPNLTIKTVDFTSILSLVTALQNIKIVISCLATLAIEAQNPLIAASVEVGVERFIPAEFGMDSKNALCMELPVCIPKVSTQKYLQEKSDSHPWFSWTGVANGLFLDWGLKVGFILDLKGHKGTLFNGGDVSFSATTLENVVKAVMGVVGNLEETKNRLLYVSSVVTTQNNLMRYAREKDGREWNVVVKDTNEIRKESFVTLASGGDLQGAMDGFCFCAMWGEGYGGNFSGHLDNKLVGVEMMTENKLRALVESLL